MIQQGLRNVNRKNKGTYCLFHFNHLQFKNVNTGSYLVSVYNAMIHFLR